MDGRTDNVKTVYPLQTKFAGGIINPYVLLINGLKAIKYNVASDQTAPVAS